MERAFSGVKVVAAGIGGVIAGAFSVAAIQQFFAATIDGLDALNDLKDATGASIENISALEDVALRTGSSFETVSTSLVKLNGVLKEAKPGGGASETLKAIGLSAEELKRIDPAEAMLKVAQALSQFSDDGNKARIVQELFGKSIREVAPLLKDLAEKGKLNGTVATEQAEAAEQFNKQLAQLSKNITDVSRGLIGDMLPSLNKSLQVLKELGAIDTIKFNLGRSPFENQLTEFQKARDELTKKQAELANFTPSRGLYGTSNDAQREKLKKDIADLEKLVKVRGILVGIDSSAGAGRGGSGPGLPSAPDVPEPKKDGKLKASHKESLIDGVPIDRVEAFRQYELAATAKVDEAAATEQLAEAERTLAYDRALERENIEATAEWREKLNKAELDRLDKLAEETKKTGDTMTAFADEAARNIQDALGDTILKSLDGDFDSIEKLWVNMLKRMAAEAIAADLSKTLLGDMGKTNYGAFGQIASALGDVFGYSAAEDPSNVNAVNGSDFGFSLSDVPSYDVGTQYVPQDTLAMVHKGERIVPASQNRPGSMGGGVVVHSSPQIYIDGRMDQAATAQLISQAIQANNRALEERMAAQGRR